MTQPPARADTARRAPAGAGTRPVWVVFARRKYEEPIYQVGTVTAESADMAAIYAQSIYDEQPWIEMVVAPRASMRTVIEP